MNPINIHTVEPKFLRRALKNGVLLHFHHPFLFFVQSIGISLLLFLTSNSAVSFLGFAFFILMFTWAFVCLRSADSDSSVIQIIRSAAHDIYGVLKYAVILSLITASALALFVLIGHTLSHHTAPVVPLLYTDGIYTLSYTIASLTLVTLLFGTLFLSATMVPYVAMYYGYTGFSLLYAITTQGIAKNWHTIGSMLLTAGSCSVGVIVVAILLPTMNDMLFNLWLDSVLLIPYTTVVYLLCREIFEGRGTNVLVKHASFVFKKTATA